MLLIGTSGYSYSDWKGNFYPAEARSEEFLKLYAEKFRTVELNFTYYRMPEAKMLAGMVERVPEGFRFSIKAPGMLTHEQDEGVAEPFRVAIQPFEESGRLAAVLAQFPFRFKNDLDGRRFLSKVADRFEGLPCVLEFRHQSWLTEAVRSWVERLGFGFCCTDLPALAGLPQPVDWVTGPLAYVRFHGRNAGQWWEHEEAWQRYDYSYSEAELKSWIPALRSMQERSETMLVYFNNHARGQAPVDAQTLSRLLS